MTLYPPSHICTSDLIPVSPVESRWWCQHPWQAAVGHSHERFRWPDQVPGVGPEWAAVEYACVGNNLPHVQRPGTTDESLGGTRTGFQLLCVWALLLSSQTPEALVSAGQARSAEEKNRDGLELEALRQKEHAAKRSRTFQRGTRYNQALKQSAQSLFQSQNVFVFCIFPAICHRTPSDVIQEAFLCIP